MGKWDEFDPLYDDINPSEKIKLKICSKCKKSKPLNEFYKNPYNKDGLAYSCKACKKKRYLEKKGKKERNINL